MKVEISEDQNTLTVDGVEYEAKLNNERPHKSSCLSCVFHDKGFCEIAMKKPVGVNASDLRRCEWPYRRDMRSIFWIEKEAKQVNSQDINFSDDENSLTIKDGFFKGEYEVKIDTNSCDDCFFWSNKSCDLGGMEFSKCAPKDRADEQSIIWIIKQAKQMTEAPAPAPAPAPHVHAELIKKWADDVNQAVWYFEIESEKWTKWANDSVMWLSSHDYAIGEMPTEPPVKMVKYDNGSIEFPEPARVELERNKQYWGATVYGADSCYWTNHSSDFDLLDKGLIQLTKKGAEKQSDALIELLKNHAQKWGLN